ncbi:hypothetical protein EJ08DRAFT_644437 [Tothia fuscella]|uniref:Uncharacterized protein n=1 Tax=Tothia fuscella TaxID=1048955 RepID=A0A9P4P3V2_9PEZI|nr:hypothetical protein EJ08DRAFT_644437 [Tothia fuscella]
MDIWGGDPWNDTAKAEETSKKELGDGTAPSGFLAGFQDEAEWGDYEEDFGWGSSGNGIKGYRVDGDVRAPFAPATVSPGWHEDEEPTSMPMGVAMAENKELDAVAEKLSTPVSPKSEVEEEDSRPEDESTVSESMDIPLSVPLANPTSNVVLAGSARSSASDNGQAVSRSLSCSERSNGETGQTPGSTISSVDKSNNMPQNPKGWRGVNEVASPSTEPWDEDGGDEDDFGEFEEETQHELSSPKELVRDIISEIPLEFPEKHSSTLASHLKFNYDPALVGQLFQKASSSESRPEVGPDIIGTSSARKSWYRLTRQQTMREFNEGFSADNYVRIAWPRSTVRKETLKIVSRWASEDRISGRVAFGEHLPVASTFGWDGSDPSSSTRLHKRRSSMKKSTTMAVERPPQSVQAAMKTPISSKPAENSSENSAIPPPVAQFSWSSSPQTAEAPDRTFAVNDAQLDALFDSQAPKIIPSQPFRNPLNKKPRLRSSSTTCKTSSAPAVANHRRTATAIVAGDNRSSFVPLDPPPLLKGSPSSVVVSDTSSPSDKLPAVPFSAFSFPSLKIDRTHEALDGTQKDLEEGNAWGGMPSAPATPIQEPSTPARLFTDSSPKFTSPDSSSRVLRKPTPLIVPHLPPMTLPVGPLSPARKAAFEAARVTRSLGSQQRSDSLMDDGNSTKASHSMEETDAAIIMSEASLPEAPDPSTEIMSSPILTSNPFGNDLPIKRDPLLNADLSVFDDVPTFAPSPATASSNVSASQTRQNRNPISSTDQDNETAKAIIRSIPDLSYMLR